MGLEKLQGLRHTATKALINAESSITGKPPRSIYLYTHHVMYAVAAAIAAIGLACLFFNPLLGVGLISLGVLTACLGNAVDEYKDAQAENSLLGRLTEKPVCKLNLSKILKAFGSD